MVPSLLLFGLDFSVGIAIFLERDQLVRWLQPRGPLVIGVLFLCSLGLFVTPQLMGWHRQFAGILAPSIHDAKSILPMTFGAMGLTVLALRHGIWQRALEARSIVWLGRVSYGLYLLHLPVALLCAHLIDLPRGLLGWALLYGIGMAAALPFSAIFFRLVEGPSIAAGNWICRQFAKRMQIEAVETRAR